MSHAEEIESRAETSPFSRASVGGSYGFKPLKTVVYGVPGVGKTTFAATWDRPILIRTEDGAGALNIPTFPKLVETFHEFREGVKALLREPHEFKTLIIDSLDWLESLVWKEVCWENGKQNIEDFGYGKGYVYVDEKWRAIQAGLDMLRERRGMNIVAIAHATPTMFDPPDHDPYMKYGIKLHRRAAALWTEWAEMLLFANYKIEVSTPQAGKAKATGNGDRVLYTQEKAAFLAKSRWPLPEQIFIGADPGWQNFHKELAKATNGAYRGGADI